MYFKDSYQTKGLRGISWATLLGIVPCSRLRSPPPLKYLPFTSFFIDVACMAYENVDQCLNILPRNRQPRNSVVCPTASYFLHPLLAPHRNLSSAHLCYLMTRLLSETLACSSQIDTVVRPKESLGERGNEQDCSCMITNITNPNCRAAKARQWMPRDDRATGKSGTLVLKVVVESPARARQWESPALRNFKILPRQKVLSKRQDAKNLIKRHVPRRARPPNSCRFKWYCDAM